MTDFAQVLQLVLLAAGGTFLLAWQMFAPAPGSRDRRLLMALLVPLVLASLAAYPRFGAFHDGGKSGRHTYHYHDLWHYVLGARYYPEVGYDKLYDCTAVALDELRREGVKVPPINEVRRLSNPMEGYQLRKEIAEHRITCDAAFDDDRWASFKADTKVWLDQGWEPRWWQVMLFDLGFNPPPSWAVIGHGLISWVPLNGTTLELLPFLDMGFVWLLGGLVVWRTWGPVAAGGYLLVLGTNLTANYTWTGGSYARQLWFGFLICGLAGLHTRRWRAAGVLLALSACMRVFPVLFAAGAGLALAAAWWRGDRRDEQDLASGLVPFTLSGLATAAVMVGASLVMFDSELWTAFFHKIRAHGDTYFVWHVGFKKWATWSLAAAGQDFWWSRGLERFQTWNQGLDQAWQAGRWVYEPLRAGMVLLAVGLSARLPPARAALLFGGTAMFCLTMPANYYYVWLAAIPVVLGSEGAGRAALAQQLALYALLVLLSVVRWLHPDALVQNAWWNSGFFLFFNVWLAATAVEELPALRQLGAKAAERWVPLTVTAVTAGALAWAALTGYRAWTAPVEPRNLVLIVADTLRADRLGAYGYGRDTSPNLDRLAEAGTVFERAYSHAPWTAPSVASVMTSKVPRDHGVVKWDVKLAPEELTLAEHLHAQGYQTFAAVSHVVFRSELGFEQGFDAYDISALRLGHPEKAVSSERVTDAAIEQLRGRDAARPFFLWAHYFDAHNDYITHPGRSFAEPGTLPSSRIKTNSDAYDSEVSFLDHHVGRLIDALDELGVSDRTVVAFVGDHGEEFGDHGRENHALQLYDEVVRVPMIVRAPGVRPGRVTQVLPTSDLAPTLTQLLGVPTPEAFRGHAVPLKRRSLRLDAPRQVVMDTVRHADKRGVVDWPWKYIHDREHNQIQLFDLSLDPKERANRAANEPAVRDRLQRLLDEHFAVGAADAPERDLSEDELEQLRALGYLGPEESE